MQAVWEGASAEDGPELRHHWVGAALVGLGMGDSRRAEHAARTGRHVLSEATRIEVLEVYCRRCRIGYREASHRMPCTTVMSRAG